MAAESTLESLFEALPATTFDRHRRDEADSAPLIPLYLSHRAFLI